MNTSDSRTSERRRKVTPLSRGIGIGSVVFFEPQTKRVFHRDIYEDQIDAEIQRLRTAVEAAKRKINKLANQPNSATAVFGAHLLIVEESPFIAEIEAVIRDRRVSAEWAVRLIAEHRRKRQLSVSENSFREKAIDIADVAEHLIEELQGASENEWAAAPESVVVARELRPSNVVLIAKSLPSAIITERGGWTSHASILARELNIPMVSGIHSIHLVLKPNDNVIVDAISGEVIIDPEIETIEKYRTINIVSRATAVRATAAIEDDIQASQNLCTTRDGTEIIIRANADNATIYWAGREAGAKGIGLFRSESLIRDPGQIPTEEEQFAAYTNIAEIVGESGVLIRTFDIGVTQYSAAYTASEINPSLGLRSIRLSLTEQEYFRTQLRALLRASAEKEIDIILPMVAGLDEIYRTKDLIESERKRLVNSGFEVGEPQLGVMIEVPSAVLIANDIAKNVDFLCLGTNDLVQYLLAVDRDNEAVTDWYQTLHPAVLRAIKMVVVAAGKTKKPLLVCGEMAGSSFYVPLLIGAGARQLSMNVSSIRKIRELISDITVAEAERLFALIMTCETASDAEAKLRAFYKENWADVFPPDILGTKPL